MGMAGVSASGQGGLDPARDPLGGLGHRAVGQVDVALCGLYEGVAQELGDGHHVDAVGGGDRGLGVAQVVKPQVGQARFVADALPMDGDVVHVARGRPGREQEGAVRAVAGGSRGWRR